MTMKGIYRTCGRVIESDQLITLIKDLAFGRINNELDTSTDGKSTTVNKIQNSLTQASVQSICSAIKMFFARIEPPLFNEETYDSLLSIIRSHEDDELDQVDKIVRVLERPDLHPLNLYCLLLFLNHLKKVTENEAANKMTAQNLGICIAPSLLRKYNHVEVSAQDIADFDTAGHVVELMIVHFEEITDYFMTKFGSRNFETWREEVMLTIDKFFKNSSPGQVKNFRSRVNSAKNEKNIFNKFGSHGKGIRKLTRPEKIIKKNSSDSDLKTMITEVR